MSNPIELNRERVSALMDGQLRSQEFADAVRAACDDADAQESWDTYHLIGDVLRAGAATHGHASSDFVARLQARLQAEARSAAVAAGAAASPGQAASGGSILPARRAAKAEARGALNGSLAYGAGRAAAKDGRAQQEDDEVLARVVLRENFPTG